MTGRRIVFHRASEAEVPALQALSRSIWREYYPALIGPAQVEYMLEKMYGAEVLREEIRAGHRYEIVTVDGADAGYLAYRCEEREGIVKLAKLYVAADFRGAGIGRAMLEHVRKAAAGLGAREIRLFVNKHNAPALAAYARFGFLRAESVVTDIGGGYVMDDWLMRLPLPS